MVLGIKMKEKKEKQGELTDKQLVAKYDNGIPLKFVEALKKMAKGSSPSSKNKGR